jgi:hypothetical protein
MPKRLLRLFGIKTDDEIKREVEQEEPLKKARKAIDLGEGVLAELERLDPQRGRRR